MVVRGGGEGGGGGGGGRVVLAFRYLRSCQPFSSYSYIFYLYHLLPFYS